MATGTRANTARDPRPAAFATTRKAPVVKSGRGPSRWMLLARYLLGVVLIGLAFLLVPRLDLAPFLLWTLGLGGFIAGNLIRPLYRHPIPRRDRSFATAIEIIHFLLLVLGLAAIGLVLEPFPTPAVVDALLGWKVLGCATAFFAVVGLRDLLYRWRGQS